jgi:hypothetical protein
LTLRGESAQLRGVFSAQLLGFMALWLEASRENEADVIPEMMVIEKIIQDANQPPNWGIKTGA